MENSTKLGTKNDSGNDDNHSVDENPIALNPAVTAGIVQDVEQDHQEDAEEPVEEQEQSRPNRTSSTRTPFTDLSQVDADFALARTLQEQVLHSRPLNFNLITWGIFISGYFRRAFSQVSSFSLARIFCMYRLTLRHSFNFKYWQLLD